MASVKTEWELRVVLGPSGSGRSTRLRFLQELFGFMCITRVEPRMLCPIVDSMFEIHGNRPFRLAVDIAATPFKAEGFKSQYETFVNDCVLAFTQLRSTFPGQFKIIFMYCDQAELAKRQASTYHPLMEAFGDMQTAIFTDCMIHLQLMLRIWALEGQFPVEECMIFSDRTGKTAEQLRMEISERRSYRNRPEGPDEESVSRPHDQEKAITKKVKEAISDMTEALNKFDMERNAKRRRLKKERENKNKEMDKANNESSPDLEMGADSNPRPSQFITRGWNLMRTTMLEIARAKEKIIRDKYMELSGLLLGESGTGKEGVAAFLHYCRSDIPLEKSESSRERSSFVTIDCTAFSKDLLESELFGSLAGAFTDAIDKDGLVAQAANGTLFLDEIGLMDTSLQAKLLRFIETRTYRKVGSTKEEFVSNCRVIAATSRNLIKAVTEGTFLVDLYNRLKAITISLPPMRERREDIPLLFAAYAPQIQFSAGAQALLFDYEWPGNIRELKQVAVTYQSAAEDAANGDRSKKMTVSDNMLIEDLAQTVTKKYIESALQYQWAMLDLSRASRNRTYRQVLLERELAGKVQQDIQDVRAGAQQSAEFGVYSEVVKTKMAADRETSFRTTLKEHIKDSSYNAIHELIEIQALKEVLADLDWKYAAAERATGINREKIRDLITKHAKDALNAANGDVQKAARNTGIELDRFSKLVGDPNPPRDPDGHTS